ncbi:uncharacterized protein BO95DRAFT_102973 [Aspergillus brunneoviolaceus CBS 621.78]|uniref:Uncharacterized protein n=1 Tax=Aspergillus brunneoviolaceus CBS 621.78 TaxID=1450534 RepID=A0ACD1GBB0_9EURO|nr:hypothetical protein BO95DRAFT_102973 [Aspergillus brunneoviolaceus CBS 621.78]RAH46528.1 hypothetical protein BO95DRAFT_102973 [Aspergillus brunneoviolaceus CBS 621.78]
MVETETTKAAAASRGGLVWSVCRRVYCTLYGVDKPRVRGRLLATYQLTTTYVRNCFTRSLVPREPSTKDRITGVHDRTTGLVMGLNQRALLGTKNLMVLQRSLPVPWLVYPTRPRPVESRLGNSLFVFCCVPRLRGGGSTCSFLGCETVTRR